MSRGKLIAIEGIDGAGTTTQARRLTDWINECGEGAFFTCEPSSGPIGLVIRDFLSAKRDRSLHEAVLALLFAADRLDHVYSKIAPKLSQGIHVVTDRYVYSSLAYQSLTQEVDWVSMINVQAPEPDLIVYLRVEPEIAASRRQHRGSENELFEEGGIQEQICYHYDSFFGSDSGDGSWILSPDMTSWVQVEISPRPVLEEIGRAPQWAVIDGSQDVEAVFYYLRLLIQSCFTGENLQR